jgi:Tfp pilus assembly protein PilN
MRAVNLLPREIPGRRERRRIDPLAVGAAGLVLVVAAAVGGGFVLERSHARSEQQKLAAARTAVAEAQAELPKPGSTPQLLSSPAALAQEQPWQQAIEGVLVSRVPWDLTLAKLARVVPESVSLASLSLDGSPTGGPGSLSLTGEASSKLAVAQLLARLTLLPELDQVKLGPVSDEVTSGKVSFSMQAVVTGPATSTPTSTTGTSTTTTTTGVSS